MIHSLLEPSIIKTSAVSAILLVAWFIFWKKNNLARTERELAYVLTLITSFITSLCSLPLVYTLYKGNLSEILVYRTWTVQVTVFFMTFLFLDLVIGSIFYAKKIDPLTGWLHHTVYLMLLIWTIHRQYCSVFVMMCLLEIPTFILSVGSVRNRFRYDYLFAITFVCTRILFHLYVIVCAWQLKPFGSIMTALTAFWPLHCHWFYGKNGITINMVKKTQ
ncbi:hypothetical protein G6F16_001078 [Rhizopus arrhizus]|nr:hypothetical protein G6F24_003795 [Rhizopus arrhizus]KAG0777557.1 hypothetical protein G6F22_011792 [Rhizopus arrhizus]KAG0795943.1 hypothetical protein G6F21_001710 [Rhizopus arrhizus]KAG0817509.1 hypothetical protein G6F20_002326 [Rhizopus arrhizus]KAG0838836.1 hypothetical protein G6F18_004341 [Rhizopus arrhizus]